jgi:LysR family glycine cleavage system transcriptional activator
MVPVAAPSIVERLGMPESSAELTRWPHVHDADRKGWSLWFQAQGIDEVYLPRGSSFDDSGLLLNAVIAGQGAGLLPAALVALDVEEGRLTRLAKATHMESFAYYLVYPETNHDRPKISAFRDWILSAASAA